MRQGNIWIILNILFNWSIQWLLMISKIPKSKCFFYILIFTGYIENATYRQLCLKMTFNAFQIPEYYYDILNWQQIVPMRVVFQGWNITNLVKIYQKHIFREFWNHSKIKMNDSKIPHTLYNSHLMYYISREYHRNGRSIIFRKYCNINL